MTNGKAIALTRWTFVGKVMSLLFNMLSRLVITFLPRSKHLLILLLQSPSAVILEPPPPNKVWHCFPICFPWRDETRCRDLSFLNVELYLDSVLKSRDITLPTKVWIVKAVVFPVVMYSCKNWTVKKTWCRRIDAFELWCWRTLESPLDCKEIKPVNPKRNQPWIFTGRTDA